MNSSDLLEGSGLGLRRGMFPELRKYQNQVANTVDFFEVAPENWINVGGRFGQRFRDYAEKFPIVCHGLSLSLGSPQPLDLSLLGQVREFLLEFDIQHYSDHLSACSDTGHLYDLMPIPFTESAVRYVAERIRTVQDFLERRIAIEHVSYYASPGQELSEIEFITSILDEADCNLLLDVNNAYVNSVNFSYDPKEFLNAMPMERVTYIHIAGHYKEAEDLRVDTHAANVIEPVWELLEHVYSKFGPVPTLLERDFKFPPVPKLLLEVKRIKQLQQRYSEASTSS
ncbi:MAG: DUF692 domain-containing protein [Gammaproteobacteria bacterium]|nr:DUF692 domain-containing protein [Gammaproteobacteria bacterium]MXX94645.1 DUF692 domain-containing protein [Gammaproteobacteria bacterium]MYF53775.1 DUF692 domain-containing protein [Gammaproteobacteria bacterium]MYK44568.1 DUF692 domain-containing protein [Gammaproteobacteria bacterium]